MPDLSPRLGLPYILPSQNQKHVTHNEALRLLDALVQLRITSFDGTTPPASAAQGETHAVGSGATGAWAGQDGRLATFEDAGWGFFDPVPGWRAADLASGGLRVYQGGAWTNLLDGLSSLGVNALADPVNRLAVAAEASLFSHDGAGHRLKINKAVAADTASLLYQTGWSGRAEMGLAGDDAFSIKVSADGSGWTTALSFDPVSGLASGAAVQSGASDTTPGRLMRADYGYGPGNLVGTVSESAGLPTGAVIESGSTATGDYVRFADGTQICTITNLTAVEVDIPSGVLFRSSLINWVFPITFAAPPVTSVSVDSATIFGSAVHSGATDVNIWAFSSETRATPVNVRAVANGRWF